MSRVLHRNLRAVPPIAVRGDGVYVVDRDGQRYLDGCGGAAVSCLGHSHPEIVAAIERQLDVLPYAHSAFFTTEALEQLAGRLVDRAPGMGTAMFVSGGSEAIEAALKLSRQYFVETGETQRRLFVARRQSYHGNTLGALAVGGNEWRRRPFAPILVAGHHISPCFAYRERRQDEDDHGYGQRVADELEAKLIELGPENVAAFVAETVVGATAGAVTAVPGYFQRIRDICDAYGVHLILDEVMCGAGRTGSFFAYEQEDIVPDIVTLAKGLASGYQPVGAMLCRADIIDRIRDGSGFFQHGHTFLGHASACAAALATLEVIDRDGLLERVRRGGVVLAGLLRERLEHHPHVGDIRGRGYFLGVEFVSDRDSKAPFDPALKMHRKVQAAAMAGKLLCYGMGGTVDGAHGDHVLIAPPYIASDEELEELADRFAAAVSSAMPVAN